MDKLFSPKWLLHIEGLTVFIASIVIFSQIDGSWLWFVILLLAPDLSAVGYLANPRIGSWTYNFAHTYLTPIVIIALGYFSEQHTVLSIGIIWLAHIGIDRAVGYGLKYPTEFKETHLNRVA